MPAILTSDFSVFNAENFLTSFLDATDNELYIGIGRGSKEGFEDNYTDANGNLIEEKDAVGRVNEGNEVADIMYDDAVTRLQSETLAYMNYTKCTLEGDVSDTSRTTHQVTADNYNMWMDEITGKSLEMTPPAPVDTEYDEEDFRQNLIGMKRVMTNHMMLMVPRINWSKGKTNFRPLDKRAKLGKRHQDYYCVNSNNEVWQCIAIGIDTNGNVIPTSDEPLLAKTVEYVTNNYVCNGGVPTPSEKKVSHYAVYVGEDQYVWKFLYDIKPELVNNGFLLDNWMPVPFGLHGVGGTITDNQKLYGDVLANQTLGAYRILINETLDDCGTDIPYSAIYRQVGLIANPRAVRIGTSLNKIETGNYVYDLEKTDDIRYADDITLSTAGKIFELSGDTTFGLYDDKTAIVNISSKDGTIPTYLNSSLGSRLEPNTDGKNLLQVSYNMGSNEYGNLLKGISYTAGSFVKRISLGRYTSTTKTLNNPVSTDAPTDLSVFKPYSYVLNDAMYRYKGKELTENVTNYYTIEGKEGFKVYYERIRTLRTGNDFDVMSGELIYLENKKPVMRSSDQKETILLLLVF